MVGPFVLLLLLVIFVYYMYRHDTVGQTKSKSGLEPVELRDGLRAELYTMVPTERDVMHLNVNDNLVAIGTVNAYSGDGPRNHLVGVDVGGKTRFLLDSNPKRKFRELAMHFTTFPVTPTEGMFYASSTHYTVTELAGAHKDTRCVLVNDSVKRLKVAFLPRVVGLLGDELMRHLTDPDYTTAVAVYSYTPSIMHELFSAGFESRSMFFYCRRASSQSASNPKE
ncbi:CUN002 hypothetical protein, ATP_GTP_A motif [Culex nigripalpus nucleopolyhedrovirus]|uniref:Uncharacterized protein n=1 Tax=Culex nigripalpus nucleopolyhedrovirus (isolate Florida/1997) TaxID=645993 RepID=Q919R3_NPVCO|nr:CUN002 hypothetical protein, ATP_GTP_A motif [Culex nigripalpus nucleopolyhedrovirus]AAK94080.1 CUN002 hypothetical protein, ATP_GTP_A motif [Culex nigripalpus nucleopolyhedrovirus]